MVKHLPSLKTFFLMCFVGLFAFNAKSQNLQASFTVNSQNQCLQGNVFSFTNTSVGSGSLTYLWNFGDNSTSTLQSPSPHTYTQSGIYNVSLLVSDGVTSSTFTLPLSVSPAPIAGFSVLSGTGNGNAYTFISTSSVQSGYITNYLWSFGDGTGSTLSNPSKTYGAAGTYNVKLVVTSDNGCKDSITQQQIVTLTGNPLNASFAVNNSSQCVLGNQFLFSNYSSQTSGTTYSWDFGDGSTATTYNTSHTYSTAGNYTVTLTVNDGSYTNSSVQNIQVVAVPTASFQVTSNGNTFQFNSTSVGNIATYKWNFGDGTQITGSNTATHTYTAAGNYQVQLIVQASAGCADTVNQQITVLLNPNVASFTNSSSQCVTGNNYQFTSNSTVNGSNIVYAWSFGDGTSDLTNSATTNHTYAYAGDFQVTLTVTSTAGTATYSKTITVYAKPQVNFTISSLGSGAYQFTNNSFVTNGTIASNSWSSSTGATANTTNYAETFVAGTYQVKLISTSNQGCIDSLTKTFTYTPSVIVTPLTASFTITGSSAGNCFDPNNVFTTVNNSSTGSGINYEWAWGDGTTSTGLNPTHTYTSGGTFVVRLKVYNNTDSAFDFKTVSLNANPIADYILYLNTNLTNISNDLHLCFTPGMDFSFIANSSINKGIMSYQWSFGTNNYFDRNGNATTHNNPRIVFNAAGTYPVKLVVITDKGCKDSITHIVYLSKPVASFTSSVNYSGDTTNNPEISFNGSASYDPGGTIVNYAWTYENGLTASGSSNNLGPVHFTRGGSYFNRLLVTSDAGCTASITNGLTFYIKPIGQFTLSSLNYLSNGRPRVTVASNTSTVNEVPKNLTYAWNFGDGGTATGATPSHTYTQGAASRTVTLTVTNVNGAYTNTYTQTLNNVYIKPKSAFSFTRIGSNDNLTIQFSSASSSSNESGVSLSYDWDFGDGTPHGTTANPTHTYANGGTYNVTLVVSNNNGGLTHSSSQSFTQYIQPTASFSYARNGANTSLNVGFDASASTSNDNTANLSYDWDFGDGSLHATTATPSHSYNAGGTYTVRLTVTSSNGNLSSSAQQQITYYIAPMPSFTASVTSHNAGGYPVITIQNNSISNDANASLSYAWNFDDGNSNVSNNNTQFNYTYQTSASSRTIVVTATNANGGLTSVASVTVSNVFINPVDALVSANPNDVSIDYSASATDYSGGTLSYSWDFGDGNSSSNASGNYAYTSEGAKSGQVTITSSNGGSIVVPFTATLVAPKPVAKIAAHLEPLSTPNQTQIDWYGNDAANPSTVSSGSIVSYDWSIDVSDINGTVIANFAFSDPHIWVITNNDNIFNIRLIVTTNFGKKDTAYSVIDITNNIHTGYVSMRNAGNGIRTVQNQIIISKNEESQVQVYPNPTSDVIRIKTNDLNPTDYQVVVVDANGKQMMQTTIKSSSNQSTSSQQLSIAHLAKGTYFVVVKNIATRKQTTTKFIKK